MYIGRVFDLSLLDDMTTALAAVITSSGAREPGLTLYEETLVSIIYTTIIYIMISRVVSKVLTTETAVPLLAPFIVHCSHNL